MDLLSRDELLQRRERLLLRSAGLRQEWGLHAEALRAPLGVADRVRSATVWLVQNPEWPLGAAVLIVLLRPRRVLRWASYAWQGYGVYRRVQRVLRVTSPPGTPAGR
jgi:hypothetical protein